MIYDPSTRHVRIFLNDVMVRDVHAFGPEPNTKGDDKHKGQVFIGVMGCSPLGEGIEAKFSVLEYRPGVREVV
jgi:hypothetical protein